MVNICRKYLDDVLPSYWYNIIPDLPKPLPPPRDPEDGPSRIDLLRKIFPREVLRQEFTVESFVKIPDEVRSVLEAIGRPTPLIRARRLEEYLKTPAKIYFKYEGVLPTGSHKVNTAIAQAYYALMDGVDGVTTETGAGQWGSAVALASAVYGLKSFIFMVKVSYDQKPGRRHLMELYGARVIPSPSSLTRFGREILKRDPNSPGSLGIGISEAIEYAVDNGYRYLVGSVMNVVLMHQSVIGLEAIKQLEIVGEEMPDVIIGCVGGGSNFAGLAYPFIGLRRSQSRRYIAAGTSAVPKFSRGEYRYDFPDSAGMLPLIKMITIGKDFIPPPIYAGGLRYHGLSPSLSLLIKEGIVEWREYSEEEIFRATMTFSRTQGIVPAPESAHAVKAVIDEAIRAREKGERKIILFNMSGHGLLDIENYGSMMRRYLSK